ncbi:ATP-dependent DNA ligase [Candidatus Woesearchaeota archaeon]|nr:ATP-dependent DNA ligase [Candidatus Woesearchaeota archaeon]
MNYSKFAALLNDLENSSKRIEKTARISHFLRKEPADIAEIILLMLGRVYPVWHEQKMGVSTSTMIKAMSSSYGKSVNTIVALATKQGDLGLTAQSLAKTKTQSTLFDEKLSIKKVFDTLKKIPCLEGKGTVNSKTKLIASLLAHADPIESKYLVRIVLEDLRIGVGIGVIRDAIAWAFLPKVIGIVEDSTDLENKSDPKSGSDNSNKSDNDAKPSHDKRPDSDSEATVFDDFDENNPDHIQKVAESKVITSYEDSISRKIYNHIIDTVRSAFDKTNDLSKVAVIASSKGLNGLLDLNIEIFKPINVMLYPKTGSLEDGFKTVGTPAAIEYKYDGFRMQIHKNNDEIQLYTRRLENVTSQFPEIVGYVKKYIKAKTAILDSEIVGIDHDTNKTLPFQKISMRIRRKYNIRELVETVPVMCNVFDLLFIDGEELITKPFRYRREKIISMISENVYIRPAKQLITEDMNEANLFYQESLNLGNEGIMMKSLNGPYKPGSRVGYGVKIKPVMDALDLVITGAEWGEGKRAGWLTSFHLSCIDDDGNLMSIGKVGTGIKELEGDEVSFNHLTELLRPLIINEKGKIVQLKPQIVIEVLYEEIQKSESYNSGYALRFPRFVRIREDKPVSECSTITIIDNLYTEQRQRNL